MTWASIVKGVLDFLNALFAAVRRAKDEELGRLKEREKVDAADRAIRDAVNRASPDSVPDDEAFGIAGNNLPRAPKKRRSANARPRGKGPAS